MSDDRGNPAAYLREVRWPVAFLLAVAAAHAVVAALTANPDGLRLANVLVPVAAAAAIGFAMPVASRVRFRAQWLLAGSALAVAALVAAVIATGGLESPFGALAVIALVAYPAYRGAPATVLEKASFALLAAGALAALAVVYWIDAGADALPKMVVEIPLYGAAAYLAATRFHGRGERAAGADIDVADLRRALSTMLDLSQVCELTADYVARLVRYDRLAISLAPAGEDRPEVVFARGVPVAGEEIGSPDAAAREDAYAAAGLPTCMRAPLGDEEQPSGYLTVATRSPVGYVAADAKLLRALAEQASPAFERARAHAARVRRAEQEIREEQLEELRAAQRALKDANEELHWQNVIIRESRERLTEVHEEAKRAVAEELHGRVQTRLYALWVKLGMIAERLEREGSGCVDELSALVEEVDLIREEDIRKLSHRLHPSVVKISAAAGLRSLRDYYENLAPVRLNVSERIAAMEPAAQSVIPLRVRLGVYRIAELALGNVVKHAQASECTVTWDYDPDEGALKLSVADDGVGFPPDARVPRGLGLVTMNDYADALGGTLRITSFPGRGTRVDVTIPFSPERAEGVEEKPAVGTVINMHWAPPS